MIAGWTGAAVQSHRSNVLGAGCSQPGGTVVSVAMDRPRTVQQQRRTAFTCTFTVHFVVIHTHTHPFNGPLSGTTRVSRYEKGKTSLDFTEAGDSEWQWHQLGHMQKSAHRSRQITTPAPHHHNFDVARCPSCCPTNSVKALKALIFNSFMKTTT